MSVAVTPVEKKEDVLASKLMSMGMDMGKDKLMSGMSADPQAAAAQPKPANAQASNPRDRRMGVV